jgi:hypothetical protein
MMSWSTVSSRNESIGRSCGVTGICPPRRERRRGRLQE